MMDNVDPPVIYFSSLSIYGQIAPYRRIIFHGKLELFFRQTRKQTHMREAERNLVARSAVTIPTSSL